jgi:serine/alanine adding enzyme
VDDGVATPVNNGRNSSGLTLVVVDRPGADWSDFVAAHPAATLYHTLDWIGAAHESFGCRTFYLEARAPGGQLAGVLPLVRQHSLAFGDRLTSLPYCNYGGPLVARNGVAEALMAEAVSLAEKLGVSIVEIRDREPRDAVWATRADKVTFDLGLPSSPEALNKSLGSKLRSQIRRVERERAAVRVGGGELLRDFYRVFAENMRDVGTPVYPLRFFEVIARRLADQLGIVIVDLDSAPAAAGLLFFFRDTVEIPWAACTLPAKARSANMRLYWECLRVGIARGAKTFDFGRCTVDTGTYRFKEQWGGEPRRLYWHRWSRGQPRGDGVGGDAGRMQLASQAWKRLPLWAANRLGPLISPGLPW